jgi:hypothetical protein
MSWLHRRWSRRVALLVADALEGRERARTLAHIERCSGCATEHAAQASAWSRLADDPALSAEPPIAHEALLAHVTARLDRGEASRRRVRRPGARWALVPVGAAALLLILAGRALWLGALREAPPSEEAAIEVPVAMLAQMERRLARERAARYLGEARDVLVQVASDAPRCDKRRRHIDVEDGRRRSRDLLVRRALVVDVEAPTVASARGVLEEVERTLRSVAALDPCTSPEALAALRGELSRGRLLMKIDLVSRELTG